MTWKRAAAFLPGIGVSLLPKLTRPMCWPAYAGLLTTLGLGFLMSGRYLFGVTVVFLPTCFEGAPARASDERCAQ